MAIFKTLNSHQSPSPARTCRKENKMDRSIFSSKYRVILLPLVLFFLFFSHSIALARQTTVSHVADGDTFTTMENEKIRLYGIDCPETTQPFGQISKKTLEGMLPPGSVVTIEPVGKDRYGRTIAIVENFQGLNVNAFLVEKGFAWVYQKYCTKTFCDEWLRHQESARMLHAGLWSDIAAIEPWVWRRLKLKQ